MHTIDPCGDDGGRGLRLVFWIFTGNFGSLGVTLSVQSLHPVRDLFPSGLL